MRKTLRAPIWIFNAARRPAWWLLAWTQRHTIGLWFRSLRSELRRGRRVDPRRLRKLTTSLFKVSSDSRLSNAPGLHSLTIVDDVVVAQADQHWQHRDVLTSVLGGVDAVNGVRFAAADAEAGEPVAQAARA